MCLHTCVGLEQLWQLLCAERPLLLLLLPSPSGDSSTHSLCVCLMCCTLCCSVVLCMLLMMAPTPHRMVSSRRFVLERLAAVMLADSSQPTAHNTLSSGLCVPACLSV